MIVSAERRVHGNLSPTTNIITEAARRAALNLGSAVVEPHRNLDMQPLLFIDTWMGKNPAVPYLFVRHDQMDLERKAALFQQGQSQIADIFGTSDPVRPVKTITLDVQGKIIALTSFGTPINRRALADDLAVGLKAMKAAGINPPTIDVISTFGSESGMVGPFVSAENAQKVAAWYFMEDPTLPAETPVHVALSHTESLLLRKADFEALLTDFEATLSPEGKFFKRLQTV